MSESRLAELRAEIDHALGRLDGIVSKLARARHETIPRIGRTDDSALIVAGYLETYYTSLETLFIRISQHFETALPSDRWHTALLEKMMLSISGIREPAVSERNIPRLRELLRFRHFRRYYVEMEWDWRRLDFLLETLDAAHPVVLADIRAFRAFVDALDGAAGR